MSKTAKQKPVSSKYYSQKITDDVRRAYISHLLKPTFAKPVEDLKKEILDFLLVDVPKKVVQVPEKYSEFISTTSYVEVIGIPSRFNIDGIRRNNNDCKDGVYNSRMYIQGLEIADKRSYGEYQQYQVPKRLFNKMEKHYKLSKILSEARTELNIFLCTYSTTKQLLDAHPTWEKHLKSFLVPKQPTVGKGSEIVPTENFVKVSNILEQFTKSLKESK